MAGFVIVDNSTRWSINNVRWRLIFEPVADILAPETPDSRAVADAVRGGLHYLDLTDATNATRQRIGLAVKTVHDTYAARPDEWKATFPLADFLNHTDLLVQHLLT